MDMHIWEIYNKNKISLEITQELREEIKSKINNNIYRISSEIKIHPSRLYDYFFYKTLPIPLKVLMDLFDMFDIPLSKMEKEITMYKQLHVPSKNSIIKPKLPLKSNPYLTSIVANLFFDGSVPKDGRGTYYNQKNPKIMNDFINKIKYVFGDVYYSIKTDHRGVLKCRMPRIVGEICKRIYDINSFGSFDSKLPKIIFNLDEEHKMSFVITAILDEGSISYDGNIMFGVSNKPMCEDVRNLCNILKLNPGNVKRKSDTNHYYFHIKSKDKLMGILEFMNKKYPLISLHYKEDRLRYYFKIKKNIVRHTQEFGNQRKYRIIQSISRKPKTVNHLAKELLIPPRSLRRHLINLQKQGKVKNIKKGNENVYFTAHLSKAALSSL